MSRVAGIQFEKDSRGRMAYVRINLKKYGNEIKPFLSSVGAIDEDQFEKDWANSITLDEMQNRLLPRIKKLI